MDPGPYIRNMATLKDQNIHRNQPYFDGAQKATMSELAEWIVDSDKVITF